MEGSSNRYRKQPFREIQVLVSANLTFLTKGCNASSSLAPFTIACRCAQHRQSPDCSDLNPYAIKMERSGDGSEGGDRLNKKSPFDGIFVVKILMQ